MRRLSKLTEPEILSNNAAPWLAEYLADKDSPTKKFRYRAPEIKQVLRDETHWKCVYCESKIGHNTPGDIEHKIPSSKDATRHFDWLNLTVACGECNRRKNDYWVKGAEFLDPYTDAVEDCLLHLGPLVYWVPGHARAEISVRTLELDGAQRPALIDRKRDVLEKARALLELASTGPEILRALRKDEARKMCEADAEFSAMVQTYAASLAARTGSSHTA